MKDFNNIKKWLLPKLDAKGVSVEMFASSCGLCRAVVYNYLVDRNRPTEETMASMCRVLGAPLEEGLSQYTPKQRGRPRGTPGQVREAQSRGR
jgi:hypothetical protein